MESGKPILSWKEASSIGQVISVLDRWINFSDVHDHFNG